MVEETQSVITLLVDRVASRLSDLDGQLKGYQPILDRIGVQTDDIIKDIGSIKTDINSVSKLLDNVTIDFYNRTDTISKNIENIIKFIEEYKNDYKSNTTILNFINSGINDDKTGLKKQIFDIQTHVEPLGKFTKFISKPIGFLIFIIGLVVASLTITNCFQNLLSYIRTTTTNVQQQNTSK